MANPEHNSLMSLDKSYENQSEYDTVVFCSNIVKNTPYLIERSIPVEEIKVKWHPIVLRKGVKPRLWLSALTNQNGQTAYINLIKDSEPCHPEIGMENTEHGFQVTLKSTSEVLVEAGDHSESSIEILTLNLRPIGLNIYGDYKELKIGSNSFARGYIENANAYVGI